MDSSSTTTMPPKPLTLIVATTRSLGIGKAGALPWPMLKHEMAFFRRVTMRDYPSAPPNSHNAVIMGSKTYASIPDRHRPLKGRTNIVVSSRMPEIPESETGGDKVHVVRSFEQAVQLVSERQDVGRAFVIGGASIYDAALKHEATEQVLLTKVLKPDFECDTFFPVDMDGSEEWRRGTLEEWQGATGEKAGEDGAWRKEGEVEYEFCWYVKRGRESGQDGEGLKI